MKNLSKVVLLSLLVVAATGCKDDFLNVDATDSIEEKNFWESETQARSYMSALYMNMFPGFSAPSTVTAMYKPGQFYISFQEGVDYIRYNRAFNDDWAMVKQYNFEADPTQMSSPWSTFYKKIRVTNYAIANAHRLSTGAKHWEGVARFFRAAYYCDMTFHFGDVPYFDEVDGLKDAGDIANYCKARTPRTEIDEKVMADLQYAIDNCNESDGYCQVNKYVAAAMASRLMLREGTYLKYHGIDANMANKCLEFAAKQAKVVMDCGKYALNPDFNSIFTSEDLSSNTEVIMARAYETGLLTHGTLGSCFQSGASSDVKDGASKSFVEAFLCSDGTPLSTNYGKVGSREVPTTEAEFFANRDPRLALTIRPEYAFDSILTKHNTLTKASGYACRKFFDDRWFDDPTFDASDKKYSAPNNTTDAPCIRLAEVLMNYCEAMYELSLAGKATFDQTVLDKTINALRDRAGVNMPHVTLAGNSLSCGGTVINDPKRVTIEAADMANGGTYTTDAILWEIRRERRVELAYEGTRFYDLKRWNKINYAWATVNPDICFGVYFNESKYPASYKIGKEFGNNSTYPGLDYTGYIMASTKQLREKPDSKYYLNPLPADQVVFYEKHGYVLTQNPGY